MAKKSLVTKDRRRKETAEKYRARRDELIKIIKNPDTEPEDRREAYKKIAAMPRDSSPVRYRRRCRVTGRPRGNYRKFDICRVTFRELALEGKLPGVTKSSW